MSQRPPRALETSYWKGCSVFVALTRPGVPGDLEGDFNGLLRIKVKLPRAKEGGKEVEATVRLRHCVLWECVGDTCDIFPGEEEMVVPRAFVGCEPVGASPPVRAGSCSPALQIPTRFFCKPHPRG